jgi:hypothetical protein
VWGRKLPLILVTTGKVFCVEKDGEEGSEREEKMLLWAKQRQIKNFSLPILPTTVNKFIFHFFIYYVTFS